MVVGSKIGGEFSTVVTTNEEIQGPHKVRISMPAKSALIRLCAKGDPKWTNYVKGIINNQKRKKN